MTTIQLRQVSELEWICDCRIVLTVIFTVWLLWIYILARACWWGPSIAETRLRLLGVTQLHHFILGLVWASLFKCHVNMEWVNPPYREKMSLNVLASLKDCICLWGSKMAWALQLNTWWPVPDLHSAPTSVNRQRFCLISCHRSSPNI